MNWFKKIIEAPACEHWNIKHEYFDLHSGRGGPYFRARHKCEDCGHPFTSATNMLVDNPVFRSLMLMFMQMPREHMCECTGATHIEGHLWCGSCGGRMKEE